MSNNRATIADNVTIIKERIWRAAEKAGRSSDKIDLMAVTKFQPIDVIRQAYLAGIRIFGENRVQEASAKFGYPYKNQGPKKTNKAISGAAYGRDFEIRLP